MGFFTYYFLEKENTKYKIFVDLDGTLTDFNKSWKDLDITDKDFRDYEEEVGRAYAYTVLKKKGGLEFWSEMPWMKDGKKLWNYIKKYKPTILTTPASFDESKEGKKIWVERELGEDIQLIFSRTKGKYASKNGILIDDYKEKIDNWIENGGIGIFHKSAEDTIKRLKKLGL